MVEEKLESPLKLDISLGDQGVNNFSPKRYCKSEMSYPKTKHAQMNPMLGFKTTEWELGRLSFLQSGNLHN